MALAQIQGQSHIGCQRVLHEATLQGTIRTWHIAVAHRFAQLLAMVVLPGKISFQAQTFALPRGMAEHLEMVHPLIGQVHVASRVVVVNIRVTHLQTMRIGKEATLRVTV